MLLESLRGSSSSDMPDAEGGEEPVQRISSAEELDEAAKQPGGVYHVDSEVLKAWQEGLLDGDEEVASVDMRGDASNNAEELEELSTSHGDDAEYEYVKMRLENDPVQQGDLDLKKVEEARAAILRKVLGENCQHEGVGHGEDEVEVVEHEVFMDRKRLEPTDEQIERRKELMQEIASGMKKINQLKEVK